MAKTIYIRTPESEQVVSDYALSIEGVFYIPIESEELPERAGAIRFNEGGLELWDGTSWKPAGGGGITPGDIGAGLTIVNEKLTLDTESLTLVSPSISAQWSLYKNDGVAPYSPALSSQKNITVDKGCKVDLAAYFSYPAAGAGQAVPTGMSGSFPGTLPAPGSNSSVLSLDDIASSANYNVTLSKPKSGLMVVGSSVKPASGLDTTGDSISISFAVRGTLIYSPNAVLTAGEIEAAINTAAFRGSKAIAFTGVNPGAGNYTYILLDSELGDITSVIQNGTDQVAPAFSYLTPVNITNAAGATRTVKPFRSVNMAAFLPGTTLTTS